MKASMTNGISVQLAIEKWPRKKPQRITGYTFLNVEVVVVTLSRGGCIGRAEAAGVYYHAETPASMVQQLEAVRTQIEGGINGEAVLQLLPPGGARNALDCALWDLEAKSARQSVWQLAGLDKPGPLVTTFTCGADSPDNMVSQALSFSGARAIKLKLTGEDADADRIKAVRSACPSAWLSVDANQGFNKDSFERLLPVLVQCEVKFVEQPFPVGQDELLDEIDCPIPIAADESVIDAAGVRGLIGRYDMANIKLDKCGGLTAGLEMARELRRQGLKVMVGSMGGTSLGMAPAFVLGQLCDVVDLDGAAMLKQDRVPPVSYGDGLIMCPEDLWGGPRSTLQPPAVQAQLTTGEK